MFFDKKKNKTGDGNISTEKSEKLLEKRKNGRMYYKGKKIANVKDLLEAHEATSDETIEAIRAFRQNLNKTEV